jgi:hypothetical protein
MQLLVKHGIAEIVNETEKVDVLWEKWINKMRDKNNENKKEIEYIERLKELYPELAKALGLIKKEKEDQIAVDVKSSDLSGQAKKEKEEQMILDMKGAALSGQTAIQSMKSVVRAETMEAVAGYLASILKTVPFPANLLLAAGAGGLVAGMMDKALGSIPNKFAQGGIVPGQGTGDTVPAMLTPGEVILNKAQQENLAGGMGGITINIQGGIIQEDYVRNELIPAINKATSLGARINA